MKHLTEDELIEYGYGEGDKSHIEEHFAVCKGCEVRYAAVQADLAEMTSSVPPSRPSNYGDTVWESLRNQLPAYEVRRRGWPGPMLFRGLGYAAVSALLLACAFMGGRLWERRQTAASAIKQAPPVQTAAVHAPPRVVVVVLSDHLDRSERFLVELKHVDADSSEMVSPLRDEARSLLVANRICRQNAKQDDDLALTGALDRLDRLLAEMANDPGGVNNATIARLQDEMNKDGLLFEIRVLRSRIPHGQGAGAAGNKGGTA